MHSWSLWSEHRGIWLYLQREQKWATRQVFSETEISHAPSLCITLLLRNLNWPEASNSGKAKQKIDVFGIQKKWFLEILCLSYCAILLNWLLERGNLHIKKQLPDKKWLYLTSVIVPRIRRMKLQCPKIYIKLLSAVQTQSEWGSRAPGVP